MSWQKTSWWGILIQVTIIATVGLWQLDQTPPMNSSPCSAQHVKGSLIVAHVAKVVLSPDSESYWGSYFKYRKRYLFGAWVLVLLQAAAARCVWPCALWSLCACAAAGCHCRVTLGATHNYFSPLRSMLV